MMKKFYISKIEHNATVMDRELGLRRQFPWVFYDKENNYISHFYCDRSLWATLQGRYVQKLEDFIVLKDCFGCSQGEEVYIPIRLVEEALILEKMKT